MRTITRFEIIPVIELSPSDYTKTEYTLPNCSCYDFPQEWDEYWRKSLADSDVCNLQVIQPGYYHVPLAGIDDESLSLILDVQLKETDTGNLNEISPLDGGIVVLMNGKILLAPQCCTSLADYKNWLHIFENPSPDWKQIWIGYPWIYGRVHYGQLQLTDYTELNQTDITDESGAFAFDITAFSSGFNKAGNEIRDFERRINLILTKKKFQWPRQ